MKRITAKLFQDEASAIKREAAERHQSINDHLVEILCDATGIEKPKLRKRKGTTAYITVILSDRFYNQFVKAAEQKDVNPTFYFWKILTTKYRKTEKPKHG